MRKPIWAVLTAVMLCTMAVVSGCGEQKSAAQQKSTEQQKLTEENMPAEQETTAGRENENQDIEEPLTVQDPENGILYQWQEISVIFPADWEGRYIITEFSDGSGVGIYQKASYEKQEETGYLCGFFRSTELLNYGAGERMLAYTDEGVMYYMIQPTDVTCDIDDEDIAAEYDRMTRVAEQIAANIRLDVENIHYDPDQYVIPISSILLLPEDSLYTYSDNDLRIARNEIYARHGKIFENYYLQSHFDSCSWYQSKEGVDEISESELNEIERENIKRIVAAEKAYEEAHPYPKQYQTGEDITEDLMGEGSSNRICYEVTEISNVFCDYSYVLTIDETSYDLQEYIYMDSPDTDIFYVTNIAEQSGVYSDEDGLEIAVLDDGPSNDPVTHFFKYDGKLHYIGYVGGHPFKEQNNGINGFNHQNGIAGMTRMDLIETTYLDGYWWYDSINWELTYMESMIHNYCIPYVHELFCDLPVYVDMDEDSGMTLLTAQKQVYFLKSDMKEWILVRGKDGTEGYIRVKDGNIVNVDAPATEVFSDLYYYD